MTTIEKVNEVLARLGKMLAEKNESYGDSAAKPLRVFSRSGPEEGLLNRIDDKLSRIANGKEFPGDNDVFDLAGYLVLLMAIRENNRLEGEKAPAAKTLFTTDEGTHGGIHGFLPPLIGTFRGIEREKEPAKVSLRVVSLTRWEATDFTDPCRECVHSEEKVDGPHCEKCLRDDSYPNWELNP